MRKKLFLHKKANAGVKGGFKIEIQTTSDGQSFTLPLVDPSTISGTEVALLLLRFYCRLGRWKHKTQLNINTNRVHLAMKQRGYNIEIKGQCDG